MLRIETREIIGGEQEILEPAFPQITRQLDSLAKGNQGTWVSNGRVAFTLLLKKYKSNGIGHIHLPAYLCESLVSAVESVGLDYSFYPVTLSLTAFPEPTPGAAVLIIHYFGWINSASEKWCTEGDSGHRVVEDYSHSFLSDWSHDHCGSHSDVFFSVRKVSPLHLGGWCSALTEIEQPSAEVNLMFWKSLSARLVKGLYLADPSLPIDVSLEDFYLDVFKQVETFWDKNLDEIGIPTIALQFIAGLEWEVIVSRRRKNWNYLDELLKDKIEPVFSSLPSGITPLGYVIRLDQKLRDAVRAGLMEKRIYCPVHWPLSHAVNPEQFPAVDHLSRTLLTLPIDQRYGEREMEKIADALTTQLKIS